MDSQRRRYLCGLASILLLWSFLTALCYIGIIVFDNSTLGGAMLSGLILSISALGSVRLLKKIYDEIYALLIEN